MPSFKGRSIVEINHVMDESRPPELTPAEKRTLYEALPYLTSTNRLYNYQLIATVRARIRPALKFHHRLNHLELILFRDARPLAFTKMGNLIALSTGLLATVADDQELIAVVAHELGHMYVVNDFTQALTACDFERLRRLELYCDSIAVATLINLNLSPSSLTKILVKLYHHPLLAGLIKRDHSHPSLADRLNVIEEFSSSLKPSEEWEGGKLEVRLSGSQDALSSLLRGWMF